MSEHHILVVEDEMRIRTLVSRYLEKDGYQVTCLESGHDLIKNVASINPSLIILDIMLPGEDGLSLGRKIRDAGSIPIIYLTALADEADSLQGFQSGADDYVTKPFSPRLLMARVDAVLSRVYPKAQTATLCFESITMDIESRRVDVSGQIIDLTLNEFSLLKVLLSEPGKVHSRRELLKATKQIDSDIYARTIDTHIKNLRKKIASVNDGMHFIRSIYGVGYQVTLESG